MKATSGRLFLDASWEDSHSSHLYTANRLIPGLAGLFLFSSSWADLIPHLVAVSAAKRTVSLNWHGYSLQLTAYALGHMPMHIENIRDINLLGPHVVNGTSVP